MTQDFIQLAKQKKRRIVLPESTDSRILEAAVYCDRNEIADIVLLGNYESINLQLIELKLSLGTIQIINPFNYEHSEELSNSLYQLRSKNGLSKNQANELSKQALYFSSLMVHTGLVDGCVAGANNPTGNVIRAALQVIGTKTPKTRLSSFFILLNKSFSTPILFADCAINISPDFEQLADIAYQSAQNAKTLLCLEAKVAMLSFSTNGSASHVDVDKVRQATDLLHEKHPKINVIGDIQFDAAISKDTLKKKWPESNFEAPANVFIFPSLDAANIGYKIAEQMGQAITIGPILQGLAKPVNDLSRGADVKSIINTIAVTCLQVEE